MWHHFAAAGVSVLKRVAGDIPDSPDTPQGPTYNLPPLTWGLLALITLIFVPAFILTSYSLKSVYTTLAIVENPNPAAYEAVASDDNDAAPAPAPGADGAAAEEAADVAGPPKPVTASIRRTNHLLRAANGWRGNFRGILVAFIIVVASSVVGSFVSVIPFVSPFIGALLVHLALAQLSAAWVHTVIRANPSSVSIWRSLPPFRRTFEATSIPIFLSWLANTIVAVVSLLIANALNLQNWDPRRPHDVPTYSHDIIWKTLIIIVVAIVLVFLLIVPTNVVLIRVQASLLPPEDDTVVSFDRSFNGTVEPAVVNGRGYVTLRDAFRTFSRASWKRLLLLYVKVYLVTFLVEILYAVAVIPVIVLTGKKVTPGN